MTRTGWESNVNHGELTTNPILIVVRIFLYHITRTNWRYERQGIETNLILISVVIFLPVIRRMPQLIDWLIWYDEYKPRLRETKRGEAKQILLNRRKSLNMYSWYISLYHDKDKNRRSKAKWRKWIMSWLPQYTFFLIIWWRNATGERGNAKQRKHCNSSPFANKPPESLFFLLQETRKEPSLSHSTTRFRQKRIV